MKANNKKTVGIIGGMGPLATVDIFRKIVEFTDAQNDSEHIHIIIDNNTSVPDRTKALLYGGESPVKEIKKSIKTLTTAGAEVLVLPCNTSHAYFKEISDGISKPIINMVDKTVEFAKLANISSVGILATDGTLKSRVYEEAFVKNAIKAVLPTEEEQAAVMGVIYDCVKRGCDDYNILPFISVLDNMKKRGAEAFVLGCTELPLAVVKFNIKENFINPTDILAKSAICEAGYRVRKEK